MKSSLTLVFAWLAIGCIAVWAKHQPPHGDVDYLLGLESYLSFIIAGVKLGAILKRVERS